MINPSDLPFPLSSVSLCTYIAYVKHTLLILSSLFLLYPLTLMTSYYHITTTLHDSDYTSSFIPITL